MKVEPIHNSRSMKLSRANRNIQAASDVLRRAALRNEPQDLDLAARQGVSIGPVLISVLLRGGRSSDILVAVENLADSREHLIHGRPFRNVSAGAHVERALYESRFRVH